jgi:hypothetical protein
VEVVLELLQLHTQGRLTDVARVGSPNEVPLVSQRHQIAKFLQSHRCIPDSIDAMQLPMTDIHNRNRAYRYPISRN